MKKKYFLFILILTLLLTTAVAVCSGLFIQKFSFGDEEKIRLGKKLVKNSLFSYAFILVINLVLSAIESLVG